MLRFLAATVLVSALPVMNAGGEAGENRESKADSWPRVAYPAPAAVRRARAFAAGRGDVTFAVLGGFAGTRGYDISRPFSSASASKSNGCCCAPLGSSTTG